MTDGQQPPASGGSGARPRQTFDPNAADPELARLAQQPLADLPPELQAEPPAPSREPHPYELPYQGQPRSPQDPQRLASQEFGAAPQPQGGYGGQPQGGGYGAQQQGAYGEQPQAPQYAAPPAPQQPMPPQQFAQQPAQTLGIDGQPIEPVAPPSGGQFGSQPAAAAPAAAGYSVAQPTEQTQQQYGQQQYGQQAQDYSVGAQFGGQQAQYGAPQGQFGGGQFGGGRIGASAASAPANYSNFDDGSDNVKRGWGAIAAGVVALIIGGFALTRGVGLFAIGTLVGTFGMGLYAVVNGHRTEKYARQNFVSGRGQGIAAIILGYLSVLAAVAIAALIVLTWFAVLSFAGAVSGGGGAFGDTAPADIDSVPAVSADALAVGDCVYDPFDTSAALGFSGDQQYQVVACSTPHGGEVVYIGEASGADADAAFNAADEACISKFEEYVGSDYYTSELWSTVYLPADSAWAAGDRTFVCLAEPFGAYETGSVKGSGR